MLVQPLIGADRLQTGDVADLLRHCQIDHVGVHAEIAAEILGHRARVRLGVGDVLLQRGIAIGIEVLPLQLEGEGVVRLPQQRGANPEIVGVVKPVTTIARH